MAATNRRTMSADALRRVADFRAVARQLLRDPSLARSVREAALSGLYFAAKAEPLAGFSVGAIVAEVGWSIDAPWMREQRTAGEPLERRHRALRAQGYAACPKCLTRLSTDADWSSWRALRDDALREIEAREGAA